MRKAVWAVIGLFGAVGILLLGMIGGGSNCKDGNGNQTSCRSGGGGHGFFFGGGSSSSTKRGGFGSFGARFSSGGS